LDAGLHRSVNYYNGLIDKIKTKTYKTHKMKKLLVITTVLSLAALSSMAQGIVNANNASTGVFIQISASPTGANPVTIGKPATAAGFLGAGPGAVTIDLYAALASANLTPAQIVSQGTLLFAGFNSASGAAGAQGTVAPNNATTSVLTLPTQTGFDGSQTLDFVFTGSIPGYFGISEGAVLPTTAAAASTGTPAAFVWGASPLVSSLVLVPVPEPSTIVLGGLGAAALLAFRRRK
jgi:hypothetical protein